MKISTPLQILHAVRHSEGMHKNALFEDSSTLVAMVTTACFMQKRRKKRVKCLFLYLKSVVEVGWSTQKYPHTGHSVINMYVVTMAWRCISPWSFHRSPQRRREMDILRYISRFPRILSKKKNPQKRRKPQLNARKHRESESRNRNLLAAVPHVKPNRHNSDLYDSRENNHKVEILN